MGDQIPAQVFKHLVKRILTGTVLNADELAMILSMKDTGARRNDLRAAVLITRQHEVRSAFICVDFCG